METGWLTTVDADDGVSFAAVSLRDEPWELAVKVIEGAWKDGYRTLLFDDAVLIFKEDAKILQQHGMSTDLQEPVTFTELTQLMDAASSWWQS